MSSDRKIKEAIEQLAGTHLKDNVKFVDCTVDEVDLNLGVCSATPIGENNPTQIINIELEAEVCDGLLIVPVIGSTISVIYSTRNTPYVYKFSDIDSVVYSGNTWQFGDGKFEGIPKVIELTSKINALENLINSMLLALKNTVIPLAPSGTYPFAPLYAALNNISPLTKKEDLANPNVTHGN